MKHAPNRYIIIFNSYLFNHFFKEGVQFMGVKVLFTYDYGSEKFEFAERLGYDITSINENLLPKLITKREGIKEELDGSFLKDIEVLVCYNPFKYIDIGKMEKLKWIQLSSVGIDQIPKQTAVSNNIIVTNNKGGYSIPMGEWIVLSMLELLKHSKKLFNQQQEKVWRMDSHIVELYGKTIGFLGTGSIASEAAKRLQGFGVSILGMNTKGRLVEHFDKCFFLEEVDEMLALCDVVVVTMPYTRETHHFINRDKFLKMKKGTLFINVARGSIVDETALVECLDNGSIGGAALDVTESEPLSSDNKLWNYDNVIITPHNSWISEKRDDRRFEIILENMKRYAQGKALMNIINLAKGY